MILYPDYYCDKITDISIDVLKENNIKALMLDIDNTIIDFNKDLIDGIQEWMNEIKKNNIKCIIVSNTNKIDKVKKVSNALNIPYVYFSLKPLKKGFRKAKKLLNLEYSDIAEIGDQVFTDVLGAKRCKMFSILVNPISEKEKLTTKIKRPLERFVIKKYKKSLVKKGKNNV